MYAPRLADEMEKCSGLYLHKDQLDAPLCTRGSGNPVVKRLASVPERWCKLNSYCSLTVQVKQQKAQL
jgi:hypothetical protein